MVVPRITKAATTGPSKSRVINSVPDSVAHIYHNGYAIIDKNDVAHLYE